LVGQAPEQIGGIATDWATYLRCSNLLIIQDKVDAKLQKRALQGKTVPVRLRLAYPMLQAASLEDDETLQELWANLIANAMDPTYAEKIHPAYVEIIKQLSADEALILAAFAKQDEYQPMKPEKGIFGGFFTRIREYSFSDFWKLCKTLSLKQPDSATNYMDNLMRLRIFEMSSPEASGNLTTDGDNRPKVEIEIQESFGVTAFGRVFIDTCISWSTIHPPGTV
jgi:hypothetical protein